MANLNSRTSFVAVAALTGLALAAAGPKLAAEPGGARPDFSTNDAAWVFDNADFVAIPGEPSPTHATIRLITMSPTPNSARPEPNRHTASPISAIPTSSRGRRRS